MEGARTGKASPSVKEYGEQSKVTIKLLRFTLYNVIIRISD